MATSGAGTKEAGQIMQNKQPQQKLRKPWEGVSA